jgi:hypothetical protein
MIISKVNIRAFNNDSGNCPSSKCTFFSTATKVTLTKHEYQTETASEINISTSFGLWLSLFRISTCLSQLHSLRNRDEDGQESSRGAFRTRMRLDWDVPWAGLALEPCHGHLVELYSVTYYELMAEYNWNFHAGVHKRVGTLYWWMWQHEQGTKPWQYSVTCHWIFSPGVYQCLPYGRMLCHGWTSQTKDIEVQTIRNCEARFSAW